MRAAASSRRRQNRRRRLGVAIAKRAGADPHARAASRRGRSRRHHRRRHQRGRLPRQGVPRRPMGSLGGDRRRVRARGEDASQRADGAAHAHRVRGRPRCVADPSGQQLVQHLLARRRQPRLRILPRRHERAAEEPPLRASRGLERRVGQQDDRAAVPVLPFVRARLHLQAVRVRNAHARGPLQQPQQGQVRKRVPRRLHVVPQRHRGRRGTAAVGPHEVQPPVGHQRRGERAGRVLDRPGENPRPERSVLVRLDARLL